MFLYFYYSIHITYYKAKSHQQSEKTPALVFWLIEVGFTSISITINILRIKNLNPVELCQQNHIISIYQWGLILYVNCYMLIKYIRFVCLFA